MGENGCVEKNEQKATFSSEQKIKRTTTKFNFFFFSFFRLRRSSSDESESSEGLRERLPFESEL